MNAPYAAIAQVYDRLLGDHFFQQLRRNFEFFEDRHLICPNSAADVACGTGTFVRYLCHRGVPTVYGTDRSAVMLRVASKKNLGNKARFFSQDFQSLTLPRKVALLTCNFDSLNYELTDRGLLRAFGRFQANLQPGGYLIIDMISRPPAGANKRPNIENVRGKHFSMVRVTRWDHARRRQDAEIVMRWNGRTWREKHSQRSYPPHLVQRLLRAAGFKILDIRDFDLLRPVTRRTVRVSYVARKVAAKRG